MIANVRGNRGVLYLFLQQYNECIEDITYAISKGYQNELLYRSRGNAFFELGIH
jgi:hypothetical protein